MSRVLVTEDLRCPVTGKQAYADEETAERFLGRIWRNPDHNPTARGWAGMPNRVYRCDDCGWWHLTSRGGRSVS